MTQIDIRIINNYYENKVTAIIITHEHLQCDQNSHLIYRGTTNQNRTMEHLRNVG